MEMENRLYELIKSSSLGEVLVPYSTADVRNDDFDHVKSWSPSVIILLLALEPEIEYAHR